MPRPTGSSGHRSFGSRSSGHRSAGSSLRSSGHRSAGSSRKSAGSGIHSSRPSGPPPPPRPHRWHTYRRGYYHSASDYYAPRGRSHPFLTFLLVICFITAILASIALAVFKLDGVQKPDQKLVSNQDHTVQTDAIKRSKIEKSLCQLTDYYKDELGYLSEKCEEGLKYFYGKTNIQPVVLTMDISKVSDYDDHEELDRLYGEMFEDEAHFLFLIFGNKEGSIDWEYSYIAGIDAVSVMDDEAVDILFEYIDDYYYDSDASDDELVSNSFKNTADKIMK